MTKIDVIRPPELKAVGLSKRFGSLTALDSVDLELRSGSFHALLGENGAGKSTLVKCIMGYYEPSMGTILVDGHERTIASPMVAQDLGIGMVYQHFTLVPSMSVEENLLLSRTHLPNFINWNAERKMIEEFFSRMPFQVDRSARISSLSAGEKQKVEILKQLYLGTKLMFLDEPTSVLTPDEADEVLGTLKSMVQRQELSVLLISHKLREVTQYADEITVLRLGRVVGTGKTGSITPAKMTELMVGSHDFPKPAKRLCTSKDKIRLELRNIDAINDKGSLAVKGVSCNVRAGEIVGVAGVSGNGQRELVEVLCGQRSVIKGQIIVHREVYSGRRDQMNGHKFFCLPEEPLRNASVPLMSVEENLALRKFDNKAYTSFGCFTKWHSVREAALSSIAEFKIKTAGPTAQAVTLSGGNLQRLVLARDLSEGVQVLVISNPCFGLDVKATADIRRRLVEARNNGAAILLLSEDLDEIFEISDRLLVMSEGRFVLDQNVESASRAEVGHAMTGHLH